MLSLKNYHIEVIGKMLEYPMTFQNGRVKMRFLTLLGPSADIIDKSRTEMLTSFADKDQKGNPIMEPVMTAKGPGKQYKISVENMEKYQEEFHTLMAETIEIDIPAPMLADIGKIKSFFNDSSVILDNRQTLVVEEVMEALDAVSAPKKGKKAE